MVLKDPPSRPEIRQSHMTLEDSPATGTLRETIGLLVVGMVGIATAG